MAEKPTTVRFRHIYPEGYEPKYASGAVGGVTPRGDLVINFFVERAPLPREQRQSLDESGKLGPVMSEPISQVDIERIISNGVILGRQAVYDLHEWLGQRIDELRKIDEARSALIKQIAH